MLQNGPIDNLSMNFHEAPHNSNPNAGLQAHVSLRGLGSRHSAGHVHRERPSIRPARNWYLPIKRCADILSASVLLVILSPCIVLGAILVKLTSRGPAFYRQVRVGKDGR